MAVSDWNWRLPGDRQDYPWDCAAASLSWCLRTIGRDYSEQDVINGLGPSRISASLGLLDATGAGLVDYLSEIGVNAENNPMATWDDVNAAAGNQPMLMGGRAWCHWTAVRMSSFLFDPTAPLMLALMNPAPGYMGIDQVMYDDGFNQLGEFAAVWFTSW